MSIESSQFRALFSLKKALQKKDIKASPSFLSFLDDIASSRAFSDIPYEDLKPPHILKEAAAFTHYSYFNGKMSEALEGADIKNNTFMRDFMVESSSKLADWLVLRNLLGSLDTYNLVVHTYLKKLAENNGDTFDSLQEPPQDERGLIYLHSITVPERLTSAAYLIEETMKYTYAPEFFWRSRISSLVTALKIGAYRHDEKIPIRREANVVTHNILRSSNLENMHAGNVEVNERTVAELKNDAIYGMRDWLSFMNALRKKHSVIYKVVISSYWAMHCQDWLE
jgi:hypothetical protein